MTTTPTPEDYQIGPEEALEINAKATQGTWMSLNAEPYEDCVICVTNEDDKSIVRICQDEEGDDRPEDRAAIAYNHNTTPGLARRLMELEKAASSYVKTIYPPTRSVPVLVSAMALAELIDVLDRTKKGRENAKANE